MQPGRILKGCFERGFLNFLGLLQVRGRGPILWPPACNFIERVAASGGSARRPFRGWRMPFTVVALPTLVCAALVRLLLADPRTQQKARILSCPVDLRATLDALPGQSQARGGGDQRGGGC